MVVGSQCCKWPWEDDRKAAICRSRVSRCHRNSNCRVTSKSWSQPARPSNARQGERAREGGAKQGEPERESQRGRPVTEFVLLYSSQQIACKSEIRKACNLLHGTDTKACTQSLLCACTHTNWLWAQACTLKQNRVWWWLSQQTSVRWTWPAPEHSVAYRKQTKGNYNTHSFDPMRLFHSNAHLGDKRVARWVSGAQWGLCFQQNNSSVQTWWLFWAAGEGGRCTIWQPAGYSSRVDFQAHESIYTVTHSRTGMHWGRYSDLRALLCVNTRKHMHALIHLEYTRTNKNTDIHKIQIRTTGRMPQRRQSCLLAKQTA